MTSQAWLIIGAIMILLSIVLVCLCNYSLLFQIVVITAFIVGVLLFTTSVKRIAKEHLNNH